MGKTRRNFIKATGAAALTGLAGCQTNNSDKDTSKPEQTPEPEKTPEENNTETPEKTETPEPDIPESYRADRKRKANTDAEIEDIGNYTTEQEWDNLTTNTEEIQRMQQGWLNQATYTPLVNQIMSGEDFESRGKVYPNWEDDDRGFFDQDAVKEEDDFESIVRWYLPAIIDHDDENYGNAPSSRSDRFGATMEKLINEHHPTAEAEATYVNSMPAHGIFGVQDTNNEKFYLIDTTSAAQYDGTVGRIGDFITSGFDPSQDINRQNLWDPYHEFQPGQPEADLPYSSTKTSGMAGIIGFALTNSTGENFDQMFITDEWMNEAYEVLRNGGTIQPITEPIEEMIYNNVKAEEPDNIGIYGSLDDTRIAVSSNEEIYESVMHEPEPQSIEDIESMLETA